MVDEELLERFGRQLLVQRWSLRAQYRISELAVLAEPGLDVACAYLGGAGASAVSRLCSTPEANTFDVALVTSEEAFASVEIARCLRPPLGLLIRCGLTAVSVTDLSGQQRLIEIPDSSCRNELAQTVAAGAVLQALMGP